MKTKAALLSILLIVFIVKSKAQVEDAVVLNWTPLYLSMVGESRLTEVFDQFDKNHDWMAHPFSKGPVRMSFRVLDLSIRLDRRLLRFEFGYASRRIYKEAWSTDPRELADEKAQFFRLAMPTLRAGGGLQLLKGYVTPMVFIEYGKYKASSYNAGKSLKFNKRQSSFNNALDDGINEWTAYVTFSLQILIPTGFDDAMIKLEPFYTMGLKQIDYSRLNSSMNPLDPLEDPVGRPNIFGVSIGYAIFL